MATDKRKLPFNSLNYRELYHVAYRGSRVEVSSRDSQLRFCCTFDLFVTIYTTGHRVSVLSMH